MIYRKHALVIGILILVIAAAAFIAGRMLNRGVDPIKADGAARAAAEFTFSSSSSITPAAELPATPPEATGLYIEMKDNTMLIQVVSLDIGIGGIVGDSSVDVDQAPKVEIVMTAKTAIYRDTTQLRPASGESPAINQTVEESTLEGLAPPTMITVWGHKSGDRIIAETLLYGNSLNIQKQ